jgi:6,7-dimethyl-8-ribityllumazine synthase
VASRFHPEITQALHENAVARLKEAGVSDTRITTVWVPGGFEIPWAAARLAGSGKVDVVICVGCVLQGATQQNHYISQACYANIQRVAIDTGVPCTVGVLTVQNLAQARARTRGRMDRGKEAAEAALELVGLFDSPRARRKTRP